MIRILLILTAWCFFSGCNAVFGPTQGRIEEVLTRILKEHSPDATVKVTKADTETGEDKMPLMNIKFSCTNCPCERESGEKVVLPSADGGATIKFKKVNNKFVLESVTVFDRPSRCVPYVDYLDGLETF